MKVIENFICAFNARADETFDDIRAEKDGRRPQCPCPQAGEWGAAS
ncbi:hypothetical protein QM007_02415 [Rothia sp. SD9660Na]|nr:hypothetical protein [Rothia sp. SD9660Na]WHS50847.1 hypothetical protein QM007_02415 [Rothia sp. SD9660Na]